MLPILQVHRQNDILGCAGVQSGSDVGWQGSPRRERDAGGLSQPLPSPTTFPRAASQQLGAGWKGCSLLPSPTTKEGAPSSALVFNRSDCGLRWRLQAQGAGSSEQAGGRAVRARRAALGAAVTLRCRSPRPGWWSLFTGPSHFF